MRSRRIVKRVAMAERRSPAGQRDVNRLFRRPRSLRLGQPGRQPLFDVLFQAIGELAEPRPFLRRCTAQRLEQVRDEPALARQIPVAYRAKIGLGSGLRQVAIELRAQVFDVIGRIRHQFFAAGARTSGLGPRPRRSGSGGSSITSESSPEPRAPELRPAREWPVLAWLRLPFWRGAQKLPGSKSPGPRGSCDRSDYPPP